MFLENLLICLFLSFITNGRYHPCFVRWINLNVYFVAMFNGPKLSNKLKVIKYIEDLNEKFKLNSFC